MSLCLALNNISSSNDLAQRAQVSILSEKSEENEDDTGTVVGFNYTDEDYDRNEDDYDSVPVDNNRLENDTNRIRHDIDNQGCVACFFSF